MIYEKKSDFGRFRVKFEKWLIIGLMFCGEGRRKVEIYLNYTWMIDIEDVD